ncbi:MAG: hypothetical protein ACYCS2_07430 [Acidimicrobiales bacterium]
MPGRRRLPSIPAGAGRLAPVLAVAVAVLAGSAASALWAGPSRPVAHSSARAQPAAAAQPRGRRPAASGGERAAPAPTRASSTITTIPVPATDLALAGCPPPPYTGPPPTPPWHPTILVPDSALPPTPPAPPRTASTTPLTGKGMWIWEYDQTDGGRAGAIVAAARAAGLHQLWVRVGDSQAGFYGAAFLDQLVPAAHRAGLDVIGWGFPYLYDPAGDARWTGQALAWRSPSGARLDGFSADIETASEGVDLTARRAALYLGLVRQEDPGSLLVATVFPPTDQEWGSYPYAAIAPFIDAMAPMVYWGCTQPVVEADQAMTRLAPLAPLHLIGQAFSMAGEEYGRTSPPAPAEITAFLQAAQRGGALGASFWSWQAIDPAEWLTLGAYPWAAGAG